MRLPGFLLCLVPTEKLQAPAGAPQSGAARVRRASIFAAGKNLGGLRPQARFGAQPPLAAALGAKMGDPFAPSIEFLTVFKTKDMTFGHVLRFGRDG